MANTTDITYPKNLGDSELFPSHIHFTFFERNSTWESGMGDQVHLYMPEKFGNPSTVQWDSISLLDKTISSVTGLGGGAISKYLPGPLSKGLAAAQQAYQNPAMDLANYFMGAVINPYQANIFRGVNLRNFSFTFKFMPSSEEDCNTIQNIITLFRKYSLPSAGAAGFSSWDDCPYLTYPGEVEIRYVFRNQEHPFLHKFKRSIIKSLVIDYTGEGSWAVMRNGFPATTTMEITMAELGLVLREDVDANF